MAKTRINDLARELEVKSRVILDALLAVGFTEHKTHSSAVENEVADKVRRYLRGEAVPADGQPAAAPVESAPSAETPTPEPADATPQAPAVSGKTASAAKKSEAKTEAKVESRELPRPTLRTSPTPAAPASSGPKMPVAPPRPVYQPPAPKAPAVATPSPAPPAARPAAPQQPSAAATPAAPAPRPSIKPAAPLTPPAPPAPSAPRVPSLNIATGAPGSESGAPQRRVIVPVAPQRPVYQAPAQPVRPTAGQPIAGRPAPGRPIYQRPGAPARPGAPGAGRPVPGMPEGRRPMHPTRPGVSRPGPTPPRGAQHGRREPRVKEGPLRYVPDTNVPSGPLPITRSITITEGVTVKDLSEALQVRAKDVIRKLLDRGLMVTVNQSLDSEIATQIAREFGAEAKTVSFEEEALKGVDQLVTEDPSKLEPRAPVVTIMGHVDHGKTSLLDAIRVTNVAGGEAGGITQHIGAYKVEVSDPNSPAHGRQIVFIDTPGHAAFTRMRARGARVTDIVVLVVSADDGVMPQTLEAIDHARAANVPIIVAVNKIDKPDAQPDRVKKQLTEHGLMPEAWGGQTVTVDVSAKAKINLNLLLEMILLVADLQDLKASSEGPGQGTVLEAELDRGRGPVARLLVQSGTLKVSDTVIVGSVLGRVRAMFDDRGRSVAEAGPSTPVELLGLESLPEAGDRLVVVNDRYKAKQMALYREEKLREQALAKSARLNLESLSQQMASGEVKELPLIIKADVQGSAEVLVDTLSKLSTDKVRVRVIHSGVGAINENDILLASASNAIIIGFNVRPERKGVELAEQEKVDIRLHSIIYELSDEIRKAMHGLLEPVLKETVIGRAEVRETFRAPKVGAIAGCYVREGKLVRDAQVRVVRDGAVIYTSRIGSLRRFKEDATEVRASLECGVVVNNFSDIKPGDQLEVFSIEKVAPAMV